MRKYFVLMIIISLILLTGTNIAQSSSRDALIVFETEEYDVLKTNLLKLKSTGVYVKFVYPPNLIIADIPDIEKDEYETYGIKEIIYNIAKLENFKENNKEFTDVIFGWNNNFMGMEDENGLAPPKDFIDPGPIMNDMMMPDKSSYLENVIETKPYGAGFWDVSEYMAGSISVTLILPESDGSIDPSTENWSASRESQVTSEIQDALNWWNNRNSNVNLTYVQHYIYGRINSNAQTSYEPITRPSSQEYLWINEIMDNFGYTSYSGSFAKTTAFINDKIDQDDTDWGTIIFVVDSYNNSGVFSDGAFAYAYLGGPYMVMTYDNGDKTQNPPQDYGIANMDAVTAHEFGHIFFSIDEYKQEDANGNYIPFNQLPLQYQRTGYYNIENTNYEDANGNAPEASIMRGQIAPYSTGAVSTPAKHMIAWRDTDGDNIIDVLDTEPITDLNSVPPNPVQLKLLNGNVDLNPLTNQNPLVPTYSSGNDITINTAGIEARYDGLFWFDGNIINEGNDFVVGPFPDGVHTVEVRATNSVGNIDPTPETFTAEFQTHFKSLSPTALTHNGGRKVWTNPDWDQEYQPGYHVVYEDNGDIYITSYVRNTDTPPYNFFWTDEILLSDGSANSSKPAISSFTYGSGTANVACVVWQQYDPSINKYHIKYRLYNNGWQPSVTLSTTTTNEEPQPVVGGYLYTGVYDWHIVWNNGNGLNYAVVQTSGILRIDDIAETDANCRNPSITDNNYNNNIGVAWDNNGDVYYQEVYYEHNGPYMPVGDPINVSCGIAGNVGPSIVSKIYGDNVMMLTWTADYEFVPCGGSEEMVGPGRGNRIANKIIVARRKDEEGRWSNLRIIQYDVNKNNITPSVGFDESSPNDFFQVIWEVQEEDKLALLNYRESVGWDANKQAVVFTAPGIQTPSISSYGWTYTSSVWSQNSASPFDIVHNVIEPPAEQGNPLTHNRVFREGIIHLSQVHPDLKGTLIVEMEPLEDISQNQIIPFAPDSLESITFVGSDYFTPSANSSQYRLRINLHGIGVEIPAQKGILDWEIFRARVKTAPVNDKLMDKNNIPRENPPAIFKRFNWSDLLKLIHSPDFYIEKEFVVNLEDWLGSSVYIDITLLNNLPVEPLFAEEIRLNTLPGIVPEGGSSLTKSGNNTSDAGDAITEYALHPAYPNPFNPTTTIRYQLPQRSPVRLTIYNMLGQQVRLLLSKTQGAGFYKVEWDGRNDAGQPVGSGIYFYRFTAGEDYIRTNKMILMK